MKRAFLLRIFDAACMRRWNDKICPVELIELDKQAHKMVIAYLLGKLEQEYGQSEDFNWQDVIHGGIFEFLHRLVLTDLKPQIFYKIMEDKKRYQRLNRWVYQQLEPIIIDSAISNDFARSFRNYFSDTGENINKRILHAAHFYATKWEFDIIERANPDGYEIERIRRDLESRQEKYYDLKGIQQLALYSSLRDFVDLCGQLRFQSRWSHITHRVPKTSVLGHTFIVALLSYLFSLEVNACERRCYNNFFTGLFHDLPEVLTRDIISPIRKSVKGLHSLIRRYEKEQMEQEVLDLIPRMFHEEIKLFTGILPRNLDEFSNVVTIGGKIVKKKAEDMEKFNRDEFNPRDGEIVQATDDLSAFIEAYLAVQNGVNVQEFQDAMSSLKSMYKQKNIAGVSFGAIYADLKSP